MFATMRFAGLRAEELVTLTWGNLERNAITEGWQLRVTGKGNKERIVPIPHNLAEDLLIFRGSIFGVSTEHDEVPGLVNVPMFGSYNSKFKVLSTSLLHKLTKKYGQEALGKKISPHWFRHTYATHARSRKVDIKAVSMLLGHNSIQTTMNYDHSFQLQQGNYGDILSDEYEN